MDRLPTHPGEMLYHEFMVPYGLSANKVAKLIGVPANRISLLVRGKRAMTADTAIRLEKLFGMADYMWIGLQEAYDLAVAKQGGGFDQIKPFRAPNVPIAA